MRGARGAILLLIAAPLSIPSRAVAGPPSQAFLVISDDLSYEEALANPALRSLARAGGIGLMTTPGGDQEPPGAVDALIPGSSVESETEGLTVVGPGPDPEALLEEVRAALTDGASNEVLVVFAVASASEAMRERGDVVTPVIVARGPPGRLLAGVGPLHGLTSETTRRGGLVANVDVAPTILDFLHRTVPEGDPGSRIRVDGQAPTELHQRYLEYRRVVTPVGVAVVTVAIASLVAALVLLFVSRRMRALAGLLAMLGLLVVSLQVSLLVGSVLSTYTYPIVFGTVLLSAAIVTALALRLGGGDRTAPVAIAAGVGLALVVVDALLGWPSGVTPLLGGSAFEGVRFYGLGNSYAGIVLAGAVLMAGHLERRPGVAIITAAALFAGLPFLGADLGGGVALFAVAGLWSALRSDGRGWRVVALAGAAAIAGLALLAVAHELAGPTHVSRTVQTADGPVGLIEVFLDRLSLNLEATAATPAVWPALAGVLFWLAVVWRRLDRFRAALERPRWRDAALTLGIGGMIGYVLNDTYGMTAVTFTFLSAALVYPCMVERWKGG